MDYADVSNRFFIVTCVAAGAGTAGVGLLAFAPKSWVGRSILAAVAVLATIGLACFCAPKYAGWLAGGGSLVSAVGVLASTASVRRLVGRCVKPLCRPRVAGLAALVAAGGLWGYESVRYDRSNDQLMDNALVGAEYTASATEAVASARSDCGTVIELFAPTEPIDPISMAKQEAQSHTLKDYSGHHIRRQPAWDGSNCHGWVFTGGRYLLLGHQVDGILSDNGYTAVSDPAAGDVCVYRDQGGRVTHTGLVRAVLDDGTVLVESKWGRLGVYLHAVGESCYGTEFAYHRTDRGGHLLSGLGESGPATTGPQP